VLSLAGCGGGDDRGGDESGLLGKAEETTDKAVAGGTHLDYFATDIQNLDPLLARQRPDFAPMPYAYSLLLKAGISTTKKPGAADVAGDAAESFELTPDGMQLTMKLRNNHKFDPRPPANGRAMDASDVAWSWNKFTSLALYGRELSNTSDPGAPIQSLETPDARTLVFKMAYPHADILQLLASPYLFIEPKDDNFDFRTTMRGSGPYFLEEYVASGRLVFKRNPDWYDRPRPYFDVIQQPLLSEYSAGLAQFVGKNVWSYSVRPADILPTKRGNPDMVLLPGREPSPTGTGFWNFSKQPDSVWKDVRLRRALSMTVDRELVLESFFNTTDFVAAGLPVQTYWNSHIGAGCPEWVDPKGTGLGEGAKYFKYDIAEAKKLVEAAGMKAPVASVFHTEVGFDPERLKRDELLAGHMNESTVFHFDVDVLDYNTSWRRARESAGAAFPGILTHFQSGDTTDIIINRTYTPNGTNAVSSQPLPGITDLVLQQRREFDQQKRMGLIQEMQKRLAIEWPSLYFPGDVPAFTLRWPWLKNEGVFLTGSATARSFTYEWYDKELHERLS
jgi:ABC-type transport system substrate-binding protein